MVLICEFSPGSADRRKWDLPEEPYAADIRTPRKNLVLHALVQVPALHLAVVGTTEGNPYTASCEAWIGYAGTFLDTDKMSRRSCGQRFICLSVPLWNFWFSSDWSHGFRSTSYYYHYGADRYARMWKSLVQLRRHSCFGAKYALASDRERRNQGKAADL